MKNINLSLVVVFLLCITVFSQDVLTDTATAKEEISDTVTEKKLNKSEQQIEQTKTAESIVNPFLSSDDTTSQILSDESETESETESVDESTSQEKQTEISGVDSSLILLENETVPEAESFDESDRVWIDIIIDNSVGISLPRFDIEPKYISTEGKPSFIFDLGIIIPFSQWFYAEVSVRYLRLSVDLSESHTTTAISTTTISETTTKEFMTFVSAPVKLGIRFELGLITPYFYADIEPAYLTASSQFAVEKVHTIFGANGPERFDENVYDINTTKQRERHQIYVGGGVGIEISYGYGTVFLDGGCQYAIFETDEPNDSKSRPIRTTSSVIYFPITIGIRFYL